MTIKAVYTFIDEQNQYHIYKYFDNSPRMAAHFINCATSLSWVLPKFDAGEFASSFIAANKITCGDIFITPHYNNHNDISYRYEVSIGKGALHIKVYERIQTHIGDKDGLKYVLIYKGSLKDFIRRCAYRVYV